MSSRSIKDMHPAIRKTNEELDRLNYSFRKLSKAFKEMKSIENKGDSE